MKVVIIADNQYITNAGLRHILSQQKNPYLLLDANNKKELIALLQNYPDAIIIIDYTLFDFESSNDLLLVYERFKNSQWVLFSQELSLSFLKVILYSSDAFSIINKDASKEELLTALRFVDRKERFVCNDITNQLLSETMNQNQISLSTSECDNHLTQSEKNILKEIALGKTTKEIAAEKNLSFHTINSHRKNIFRKLGVNNVHEATKYAMRAGIIDLTEYYI